MFRLNIKSIILKLFNMIPRFLFISLATILLSSILLFIYFKNRISVVEDKVNVIFQLVQNHTDNREEIRVYESSPQQPKSANLIEVSDVDENEEESDSDENDTSDDSDNDEDSDDSEDSDEENNGVLNLENDVILGENVLSSENEIKKISLDLETSAETLEQEKYVLDKQNNSLQKKENEKTVDEESEHEESEDEATNESENENEKTGVNYTGLKVAELRKICEEKELDNYKGLKKAELIQLLESS